MARPISEDPRTTAMQIALLRAAGEGRRTALARSLTRTVVTLARRAIRAREPEATEEEIGIRFVELHYGPALAAGVRRALRRPSG